MKKFVHVTIVAISTVLAGMFLSACEPEYRGIDCKYAGLQIFEKVYGPDSSIVIYPIITPNNYDFCDSMVYDGGDGGSGAWVRPDVLDPSLLCTEEEALEYIRQGIYNKCPCRINPEDLVDDRNPKFEIIGIEKFKYNKLFIRVPNDTIKIRTYIDYKNVGDVFQGIVSTDTALGYYEFYNSRLLASGIYEYELILFKDPDHQVAFDTIINRFAIITSRYREKNRNCLEFARHKDDPLLK